MTPLTGPLAAFGEADTFCVEHWNGLGQGRHQGADGQTHPVTDPRQGLAVGREPRRHRRRRPHDQRRRRHDDGGVHLRHGQSGRRSGRSVRRSVLHALTAPGRTSSSAAAARPTSPSSGPTTRSGASRPTPQCSWTSGVKFKTNKTIGLMCAERRRRSRPCRPEDRPSVLLRKAPATRSSTAGAIQDGSRGLHLGDPKFKAAGCEIVSGVMIPPDFVNFWKQVHQQGYQPKVCTMPKALLFPSVWSPWERSAYGLTVRSSGGHPTIRSSRR